MVVILSLQIFINLTLPSKGRMNRIDNGFCNVVNQNEPNTLLALAHSVMLTIFNDQYVLN